MHEEKSFLEDPNEIGILVKIAFGKVGKTSIEMRGRAKAGEPLKEVSTEDASEAQVNAVLSILNNR